MQNCIGQYLQCDPVGDDYFVSLGVGMLLAALTVKFRDIMHLYSVFTTGLLLFDTGYLSNVNSARVSPHSCKYQSSDEYGTDVPGCDVL